MNAHDETPQDVIAEMREAATMDGRILHDAASGVQLEHWATRLEAALAAPKEAGDNPFAFDTLVAYGLANGANVVNGMPWSFKYMGLPVTHENDNHYLVNMPDGSTLNVYRSAEPHADDGPWPEWVNAAFRAEHKARLALAAPQADQQGVPDARPVDDRMTDEAKYWRIGWNNCRAEMLRRLAAKPSDQQGASLEGEAVAWTVVGPDGKSSIGGWMDMSYYEWPHENAVLREGHRYAFAYEPALSKASPDDQRQDSPPTEAAAAVGELPAKWREFADGLDRKHDLTFAQICMRDAVRDCADTLEAALSPTTSAAREGSNG